MKRKKRRKASAAKSSNTSQRRKYNRITGEGMDIDTLFLQGRIDNDTYIRYLREYERQQERGMGRRAYCTIVGDEQYYVMTDKMDYIYPMRWDDSIMDFSPTEIEELAEPHSPLPRVDGGLLVREIEKGGKVYDRNFNLVHDGEMERWRTMGHTDIPIHDTCFEDRLDAVLRLMEG